MLTFVSVIVVDYSSTFPVVLLDQGSIFPLVLLDQSSIIIINNTEPVQAIYTIQIIIHYH